MTSRSAPYVVVAGVALIVVALIAYAILNSTAQPRHNSAATPSESSIPQPSQSPPPPPPSSPPASAPTPAISPALYDNCATGWLDTSGNFHAGIDTNPPDASGADPLYQQDELQVTFTNAQTYTQTIATYNVIYLNSSGTEIGTDQETVNDTIPAGTSWTDTEQMNGARTITASACQVTTWSGASLPASVTTGPRPGTYYVDCSIAQCTGLSGAGPYGTTCSLISTNEQLCQ